MFFENIQNEKILYILNNVICKRKLATNNRFFIFSVMKKCFVFNFTCKSSIMFDGSVSCCNIINEHIIK